MKKKIGEKGPPLRLDSTSYAKLHRQVLGATAGAARFAVACTTCRCTTSNSGAMRVATSNRTLSHYALNAMRACIRKLDAPGLAAVTNFWEWCFVCVPCSIRKKMAYLVILVIIRR